MEFYNHRFDFLRKSNRTAPSSIVSASITEFIEHFNNMLPVSKEIFENYFPEDVDKLTNQTVGNVVNGSTCFFVDKGDFYIFYEGSWYNPETGESYNEGDNPYQGGVG